MIETDDILPDETMLRVIKDDDNVYPQHFSEEALTAKNWWECGKS